MRLYLYPIIVQWNSACSIESGATLPRCGHDCILTAFESSRIDRDKLGVMYGLGSGHDLRRVDKIKSTCPGLNPRFLYIVIHGDMRYKLLLGCFLI